MNDAAPPQASDQPKTLAEAARQRRDLVSGEVMPEARLIRFVASPDGKVVPDLPRSLPGRGMWVAATRAAALGLHHHRLGSAMAEALAHDARVHGPASGLEGQRRTTACTGRTVPTFIFVACVAHTSI